MHHEARRLKVIGGSKNGSGPRTRREEGGGSVRVHCVMLFSERSFFFNLFVRDVKIAEDLAVGYLDVMPRPMTYDDSLDPILL
jgi:hypothetical protein